MPEPQQNRKVTVSYELTIPDYWTDDFIKQAVHSRITGPITEAEISSITVVNMPTVDPNQRTLDLQ